MKKINSLDNLLASLRFQADALSIDDEFNKLTNIKVLINQLNEEMGKAGKDCDLARAEHIKANMLFPDTTKRLKEVGLI